MILRGLKTWVYVNYDLFPQSSSNSLGCQRQNSLSFSMSLSLLLLSDPALAFLIMSFALTLIMHSVNPLSWCSNCIYRMQVWSVLSLSPKFWSLPIYTCCGPILYACLFSGLKVLAWCLREAPPLPLWTLWGFLHHISLQTCSSVVLALICFSASCYRESIRSYYPHI